MSTECRRIECQPSVSRVSAEPTTYRPTSTHAKETIAWHISRSTLDRLSPVVGRVRPCIGRHVDRLSTEWRPICQTSVDRVSIACRSRCRSLVSIDTRSRVSLVHMIPFSFIQVGQRYCILDWGKSLVWILISVFFLISRSDINLPIRVS